MEILAIEMLHSLKDNRMTPGIFFQERADTSTDHICSLAANKSRHQSRRIKSTTGRRKTSMFDFDVKCLVKLVNFRGQCHQSHHNLAATPFNNTFVSSPSLCSRSPRCPRWGARDEQNWQERDAAVEPRSRQPQPHLQIYHPVQGLLLCGCLEGCHYMWGLQHTSWTNKHCRLNAELALM